MPDFQFTVSSSAHHDSLAYIPHRYYSYLVYAAVFLLKVFAVSQPYSYYRLMLLIIRFVRQSALVRS